MKKKALIITTISGFLSKFLGNDVAVLQELGYEVHYASNLNKPVYDFNIDELKARGIVVHHIDIEKSPLKLAANSRAFRQLKKIIDTEHIELVHCHNPLGGVVGRLAGTASKSKPYTIYTAHGLHFFKGAKPINWMLYYPAERLLARHTDTIITINSEDYERAQGFKLRKKGVVNRIHGVGVDTDRFKKNSCGLAVREKYNIPAEAFHIVTAAELVENKNQKTVIEAIASLPYTDIYYSICGKGPTDSKLRKLIEKAGLTDRVQLLGYCNDMPDILSSADCFAFPSYREGLGIAAVEALACGVPVIASDNRGTKEYMVDGINGLVCQASSVAAFAGGIARLYSDMSYREGLTKNCRAKAKEFSTDTTRAEMHRILSRVDREIERRISEGASK